jgi:hypothetical protein
MVAPAALTAPPAETALREANVPVPASSAAPVSLCSTVIRSGSTPSAAAASCAIVVAVPCPIAGVVVHTRMRPSSSIAM